MPSLEQVGEHNSWTLWIFFDSRPWISHVHLLHLAPVKPELKALVLIPVTTWYKLGLQLDICETELDHIRDNYYRDSETCKIEMFKLWIRENPSHSYEQLVKALVTIGEKTEADRLCRKYGKILPANLFCSLVQSWLIIITVDIFFYQYRHPISWRM